MNVDVFTTMPSPVKRRQEVVTAIPNPDQHPRQGAAEWEVHGWVAINYFVTAEPDCKIWAGMLNEQTLFVPGLFLGGHLGRNSRRLPIAGTT
jgi:hypothetical protein